MSSFSCPHHEEVEDLCLRLDTDCVPGRPGRVLPRTLVYAVPVEERIREKERLRREREARGREREREQEPGGDSR